jgi:hypothetical protein
VLEHDATAYNGIRTSTERLMHKQIYIVKQSELEGILLSLMGCEDTGQSIVRSAALPN